MWITFSGSSLRQPAGLWSCLFQHRQILIITVLFRRASCCVLLGKPRRDARIAWPVAKISSAAYIKCFEAVKRSGGLSGWCLGEVYHRPGAALLPHKDQEKSKIPISPLHNVWFVLKPITKMQKFPAFRFPDSVWNWRLQASYQHSHLESFITVPPEKEAANLTLQIASVPSTTRIALSLPTWSQPQPFTNNTSRFICFKPHTTQLQ